MPPRHNVRRALAAATALSVTVFGLVLSTPAMAAECDSTIDVFTASPADSITVETGGSAETVIDVAVTDCVETHPTIEVEAVRLATGAGDPVIMTPTAPGAYQGVITWSDAQAGAYKLALNVLGHLSDGSISLLTTSLDYTVVVDPPDPPEVTPPSVPQALTVSNTARTSGVVSWEAPAETGGSDVTGYRILKPGTDVTVKANVRSYTVTKLTAGKTYTIKVQAENAVGYGSAAAVALKTKPLTKPSAPRSLKASKTTRTSGKVSWRAPADNGGTKITGYRIIKPGKDVTVKAKARSYTVKKLKAGRTYTIKVQARNAKGYGPAGTIKFKTKPPAPPKPKHYPNCAALQKVYPHGVGLPKAVDSTSGDPVTNFYRSAKLYNMNNGPRNAETGEYDLDRDNDGVACEKK
jgi:Fibronectin type III domain/Excalibur calcium-binding domain